MWSEVRVLEVLVLARQVRRKLTRRATRASLPHASLPVLTSPNDAAGQHGCALRHQRPPFTAVPSPNA